MVLLYVDRTIDLYLWRFAHQRFVRLVGPYRALFICAHAVFSGMLDACPAQVL